MERENHFRQKLLVLSNRKRFEGQVMRELYHEFLMFFGVLGKWDDCDSVLDAVISSFSGVLGYLEKLVEGSVEDRISEIILALNKYDEYLKGVEWFLKKHDDDIDCGPFKLSTRRMGDPIPIDPTLEFSDLYSGHEQYIKLIDCYLDINTRSNLFVLDNVRLVVSYIGYVLLPLVLEDKQRFPLLQLSYRERVEIVLKVMKELCATVKMDQKSLELIEVC